jgi:predicted RecB family nuclease
MKITVSQFIQSLSCLKSVYLQINHPELKDISNDGHQLPHNLEVKILGKHLFSDGYDVTRNHEISGTKLLEETRKALDKDLDVLYGPEFISSEQLYCSADILVRAEKRNRIIDIRASASIKPQHLYQLGYKYRILSEYGFAKKTNYEIAYINRNYVRKEKINVDELFIIEDFTNNAIAIQPLVSRELNQLRKALSKDRIPSPQPGVQCNTCEFKNSCLKGIPRTSIFNINGKKKFKITKLISEGATDVQELPRNILERKQLIQVDSNVNNEPYVNKKAIKEFLTHLRLDSPHFYIDFETFLSAVPKFPGISPYENICFQYSALYYENAESDYDRREFLAQHGKDPRKKFIENFLTDTKEAGTLIVYNAKFETNRLKELAKRFPQYADEINNRIGRIADLMIPFENRDYYHPSFGSKFSLKTVLPALCEDMYSTLAISNGAMAMSKYLMLEKVSVREQLQIRQDLKNYCFVDVLAMRKIIEALQKLISKK